MPTDRLRAAVGISMRRRAFVATLASASLSFVPSAGAATNTRAILTSTTTVTASGSAYVPVSVPRSMLVSGTTAPQVTVSNPAAFVALALISDTSGNWPPGLVVAKVPVDGTVGYAYAWIGHVRGAEDTDPIFFTRTLPAGNYKLYLVTSAPTTVTIRLPLQGGAKGSPPVPLSTTTQ